MSILSQPILTYQAGDCSKITVSGQQRKIATQGNGGNQRIDGGKLPATATQRGLEFSRQFRFKLIDGIQPDHACSCPPQSLPTVHSTQQRQSAVRLQRSLIARPMTQSAGYSRQALARGLTDRHRRAHRSSVPLSLPRSVMSTRSPSCVCNGSSGRMTPLMTRPRVFTMLIASILASTM